MSRNTGEDTHQVMPVAIVDQNLSDVANLYVVPVDSAMNGAVRLLRLTNRQSNAPGLAIVHARGVPSEHQV